MFDRSYFCFVDKDDNVYRFDASTFSGIRFIKAESFDRITFLRDYEGAQSMLSMFDTERKLRVQRIYVKKEQYCNDIFHTDSSRG